MANILLTLLALLPFVLIFLLIIVKRWTSLKTMPLVWGITVAITLIFWHLSVQLITASFIKGALIAIEIMLIVFGAIWILEILKRKNQMNSLQNLLGSISHDIRVQALIIAFLFGALIEGLAGFGTPAAIAAPLLVSLGFTPLIAVVISLIANSTPVSFGAAGLPVLLGLGSLGFPNEILREVTSTVALFHATTSIIIPFAMIYFILKYSKYSPKIPMKKAFKDIIPFAILVWVTFAVPYYLISRFIGPELPSILSGLIGLTLAITAAHFKILTPKQEIIFKNKKFKHDLNFKKSLLAIIPYLVIIILLASSRIIPSLKSTLQSISLDYIGIINTNLTYSFLPLFTPSFSFILAGIICLILYRSSFEDTKITLKNSFNKIKYPLIALIFILALVQLFLISEQNPLDLPSIPLLLADSTASIFKSSYPLISPFIGQFGAFITGSNTVSNLLLGSFQAETASALGISVVIILSLQVLGGSIGNMIALHNVLAASATVGLQGQTGNIIRKTIWVALLYAAIAAVLGFVLIAFS